MSRTSPIGSLKGFPSGIRSPIVGPLEELVVAKTHQRSPNTHGCRLKRQSEGCEGRSKRGEVSREKGSREGFIATHPP